MAWGGGIMQQLKQWIAERSKQASWEVLGDEVKTTANINTTKTAVS